MVMLTLLCFKIKDKRHSGPAGLLFCFHSELNHNRGCEAPPFSPTHPSFSQLNTRADETHKHGLTWLNRTYKAKRVHERTPSLLDGDEEEGGGQKPKCGQADAPERTFLHTLQIVSVFGGHVLNWT